MRSNGETLTMEVPLASVPLVCLGLDADMDDVPPSPTPDPAPTTLAAGTFFQQGFLDCAQEALRFLTEEEGMPEENPVVTGLKQHLIQATPHLTPLSSANLTSAPVFTFPTAPSVIRSKHHLSSGMSQAASYGCLSSSSAGRGRFAPYTVPSHHSALSRCGRRDMDKQLGAPIMSDRNSALQRCSASMVPSLHTMERVFADDLITTDDLHGVLKCLGSGQSSSSHLHHQHSVSESSTTPFNIVESQVNSVQKRVSSLDDSGVELLDEVDAMAVDTPTVTDVCVHVESSSNKTTSASCVHILDTSDYASVTVRNKSENELIISCADNISENCFTADTLPATSNAVVTVDSSLSPSAPSTQSPSSITCTSDSQSLTLSSPQILSSTSSLSLSSAESVTSSPSSQLTLLSSLSSGSHRLTMDSTENNGATASRIQSLANEILLLLQEEAEAQDGSEDEDEDDDSSVEPDDSDFEDRLLDLESEP